MSIWDLPQYLRDELFAEQQERRDRERWNKMSEKEKTKRMFTRFNRKELYAKRFRQYDPYAYAVNRIAYKDWLKRDRFHRTRYGVTPMKPVDMTKRLWKPPAWSSVHARKFYPMPRIKREVSRREPLGTRMVNSIKRNRLPRKRNTSTYYSPGYPEDGLALRRRFIEKSNKY